MKIWQNTADKQFIWVGVVCIILFVASFFLTSPDRLGPFGITFWFTSLALVLVFCLALIRFSIKQAFRQKGSFKNLWLKSVIPAVYATVLLALSSLKQLTIRDVVLTSILILLIEFYRRRR